MSTDYILRLPEVKKITGLGRSTIYSRMKDKTFPKSISLGIRSTGWLKSEIDGWLESIIKNRLQ